MKNPISELTTGKTETTFKHIYTDIPLYAEKYQVGSQLLLQDHRTKNDLLSVLASEYEKLTNIKVDETYTVHLIDVQNIINYERYIKSLNAFERMEFLHGNKIEDPLRILRRILVTGRPKRELVVIVGSSISKCSELNDETLKNLLAAECIFISKDILG